MFSFRIMVVLLFALTLSGCTWFVKEKVVTQNVYRVLEPPTELTSAGPAPNRPDLQDLSLRSRDELLEAFADLWVTFYLYVQNDIGKQSAMEEWIVQQRKLHENALVE